VVQVTKVLIKQAMIPAGLLTLYSGVFLYLSSTVWGLPIGVNTNFWEWIAKGALALTGLIALLVLIVRRFVRREGAVQQIGREQRLTLSDAAFALVPFIPLTQYVFSNRQVLTLFDGVMLVFLFALFTIAYVYLLPFVFSTWRLSRPWVATRTWLGVGLAFVWMTVNMPSLSQTYKWFAKGELAIQLVYFAGILLVSCLLISLSDRKLVVGLILVGFVANVVLQAVTAQPVMPQQAAQQIQQETAKFSKIESQTPARMPNIYLLLYDAYAPEETMAAYGIDNTAQWQFLEQNGFVMYPGVYSAAAATLDSMGRVFEMDAMDPQRKALAGDGAVQHLLRQMGYKICGVFSNSYAFWGLESSYDYSFPAQKPMYGVLLSAILVGEFRFDIGFEKVSGAVFWDAKQNVLTMAEAGPVFAYIYLDVPGHSQNSGVCLPDEVEQYQKRLQLANRRMRRDVEEIVRRDASAIIVVAGDHGPYLTKNCTTTANVYDLSEITRLDIQDRFGTFLAIRWPTDDYVSYDRITILQDLFPAIFAYLYQDESFLEWEIEPEIVTTSIISGASVRNGVIQGGVDDGQPLFLSGR